MSRLTQTKEREGGGAIEAGVGPEGRGGGADPRQFGGEPVGEADGAADHDVVGEEEVVSSSFMWMTSKLAQLIESVANRWPKRRAILRSLFVS